MVWLGGIQKPARLRVMELSVLVFMIFPRSGKPRRLRLIGGTPA